MARVKQGLRKEIVQTRLLDSKGTITRNTAISRAVTCQWRRDRDRAAEEVTMAILETTEETTNNATKEANQASIQTTR